MCGAERLDDYCRGNLCCVSAFLQYGAKLQKNSVALLYYYLFFIIFALANLGRIAGFCSLFAPL